jgi:hypothetical protein
MMVDALKILFQHRPVELFAKIAGRLKLRKQYNLYMSAKKSSESSHVFPKSALAHKYCIGKGWR